MRFPVMAATALAATLAAAAQATADEPAASSPTVSVASTDTAYSAAGLYNLANSYARAGKPGLAVLNYERAALLAPNDADIQSNLKQARASAHLPVEARSRLEGVARRASPLAVALIGVFGVLLVGSSLLAGRLFPRRRVPVIVGSFLGLSAIGFTLCNTLFWAPKLREAVVIAATTPLRATPAPMSDPLQQLSEAETVAITQGHEDFVLVRTASGRRGWVARADLADVVPQNSGH